MPQPFWKTDMKLIILDRDGVINQDRDDFVKSADEWVPLPGSMDAVAFLSEAGYTVAVATNQSGIGRGLFTMQELTEMHNKMHKMELPEGTQVFDDLMAFSQYLMGQDEAETEAGHAVVA